MRKVTDPFEKRLASARGGWQAEDYSQRILITDRRIAIASDVHIPYHNEKLVADFLHKCQDYQIEAIVWLGDLLDHHTFSSWGRTDYTTHYTREREIARTVLEMASEIVPVQYWSLGNHEERLFRKVENQLGMEDLARLVGAQQMVEEGKLILSDNPSLDAAADSYGKPRWMLTHPAKYGSTPLVVPGELAGRYQQNVLSAHAHHWGMGTDKSGHYTVVETGGLFDPRFHQYAQHRVTGHRAWVAGWWFLIDGYPLGFRGEN